MTAALDPGAYNEALPAPPARHPEYGEPVGIYPYYARDGRLVGFNLSFHANGMAHEATLAMNSHDWVWTPLPTPTPLYGFPEMSEAPPDAPICLCDSEAAADAARAFLPRHVVVAWHGGRKAIPQTDWTVLAGRDVIVWAAAGKPPQRAAQEAARAAKAAGADVRLVRPPEGATDGWNAAAAVEEGWDEGRVTAWLLERRVGEPHILRAPDTREVATEYDGEAVGQPLPTADDEDWPFQCLGHDHGDFWYLPKEGGQAICLSGAAHTKAHLLMLAPHAFFQANFGVKDREGWDMVSNALIRHQYRVGIYDPTRLRGRGAWWDEGRVVVHLGNRLMVNGVETDVRRIKSEYIYEQGLAIRRAPAAPLMAKDSARLIGLCKMLSWDRAISAYCIAGWCALAPICGALEWRPHIHVTGQAGSGKSWVVRNLVTRVLGNSGLSLAASVTEPGIRGTLGSDALPVVIDEFEAKDANGIARIQSIYDLMRYSSSESDAVLVKGTMGGNGVRRYKIRSMFLTSAIGNIITDYADKTRTTVVTLRQITGPEGDERFAAIKAAQAEIMTPEWIAGFHARIISLIPVIRHNAAVFADAGAAVLGTRRLGDQIGALLAGAYALTSGKKITRADAEAWISAQDWSEEKEIVQDTDGPACLALIMEHQLQVETRNGGWTRRSIGELTDIARRDAGNMDEQVNSLTALATLRRHGVAITEDGVIGISNVHSEIAKILRNTPWATNWKDRLRVIPGARPSGVPIYFAHKDKQRAILVPG